MAQQLPVGQVPVPQGTASHASVSLLPHPCQLVGNPTYQHGSMAGHYVASSPVLPMPGVSLLGMAACQVIPNREPLSQAEKKWRRSHATPLTAEEALKTASAEGLTLITVPSTKTGYKGAMPRRTRALVHSSTARVLCVARRRESRRQVCEEAVPGSAGPAQLRLLCNCGGSCARVRRCPCFPEHA